MPLQLISTCHTGMQNQGSKILFPSSKKLDKEVVAGEKNQFNQMMKELFAMVKNDASKLKESKKILDRD
jgi:hypothetical protein